MVDLETVENPADVSELKELIQNHQTFTGSTVADRILKSWDDELANFRKVMPVDYKRALEELARESAQATAPVEIVATGGQN
jgi:glutamate synthase (NADPH/NADH) large chain